MMCTMDIEKTKKLDKEYQYCLRCGRKLRTVEAKMRGRGKVCAEKAKQESQRRLFNANCDT